MKEGFRAARRFRTKIQIERSFVEDFFARVTGEAGETFVDVEVGGGGEKVDGEDVGGGAESGREQMLGVDECALGFKKFLGDAALFAVGEDKTNGRAEEGCADGDPGKGNLINGNGAPHKENEEWDHDGEAVGDGEIAEAGDGLVNGGLATTRRCDGKENDGETGKEEKRRRRERRAKTR